MCCTVLDSCRVLKYSKHLDYLFAQLDPELPAAYSDVWHICEHGFPEPQSYQVPDRTTTHTAPSALHTCADMLSFICRASVSLR